MALNNKDIQALFDRKTSSADILAAKDVKEERELNSWDDMFTDLFELNVEGKNIIKKNNFFVDFCKKMCYYIYRYKKQKSLLFN